MRYLFLILILPAVMFGQKLGEIKYVNGRLSKWTGKGWATVSSGTSSGSADTTTTVAGLSRLTNNYFTKDSTVSKLIAGSNVTVQKQGTSGAWKISLGSSSGIPYSDTTSLIAMQWELDRKLWITDTTNKWAPKGSYQAPIANLSDTSKYFESADSASLFYVKLANKQATIANLSDTSKYVEGSDTTNRWAPKGSYQAPISNLADTSKYFESADSASLFYVKLAGKQATIANLADTSKYFESADSASLFYVKLAGKQATISNIADTSKYVEAADTTYLFAGKLGGWTEVQRTADTTLNAANVAFVNLGDPQFTMAANGVYEVTGRIFYVRSNSANGVTLGLNAGGSPGNVGLVFSAVDNSTDGTGMVKSATVNATGDSLQLVNTTVTTRQYIDIDGTIACDGSNRLFGLKWHLEVASSGVTISRGSYIRYRKLY